MHLDEHVIGGLIDEIDKIARELSPEEEARINVGEKILGAGTGLIGVGVPSSVVTQGLGMSAGAPAQTASTMADVGKIRAAMDMPDPVQLSGDPRALGGGGGGVNLMPVTGEQRAEMKLKPGQHSLSVADPRAGVGTLAHEMGHGSIVRGRFGRAVRMIRNPAQLLGGLGSVGMATMGDTEGDAVKYAPLVGAVGALPTIGEEAAASIKGLRALRRAGYSGRRVARAAGRNLLGLGSYIAGIGVPMVATPYAIGKARKMWRKRLEEDVAGPAEQAVE